MTKSVRCSLHINKAQNTSTGPIRKYSGTIYRPGQIRYIVTMSLCFLKAFQEKQKGNITEEEYIHHLSSIAKGSSTRGMT
jgi:hypothetical protein